MRAPPEPPAPLTPLQEFTQQLAAATRTATEAFAAFGAEMTRGLKSFEAALNRRKP